jgi:hypothetical protein
MQAESERGLLEAQMALSKAQEQAKLGMLNLALDSEAMPEARDFALNYVSSVYGGNNNE